jgi:putative exporter of polyketide antibiotics
MPAQGFDVVPLAVLTAIAAALVAAGLAGLRRRDITAGA